MNKPAKNRSIFVYADWKEVQGLLFMGTLHAELVRGKEIFFFKYEEKWLQSEHAQLIDPDLQLFSGLHYLNDEDKTNFGIFLDSSPDRWGRILMRRREAAID